MPNNVERNPDSGRSTSKRHLLRILFTRQEELGMAIDVDTELEAHQTRVESAGRRVYELEQEIASGSGTDVTYKEFDAAYREYLLARTENPRQRQYRLVLFFRRLFGH